MSDYFDGAGIKVQTQLLLMGEDQEVCHRYPRLAWTLRELAGALYTIERELSADLTGTTIEDHADWQIKMRELLFAALMGAPSGGKQT